MFEKKLQSLSLKNKLNYGYKFIIMLMIISGFFAIVSLTVFFVTIQGGMSGGQLGAGAVKNNLIHFIASIVFIVMFIIAAVIVARKIGNYAVNSITQPIAEIEKVAKDLAAGDLHSELEFHSDDEVGLLAHNMRKSIRILGSYVDDIDRAMKLFSEGDFDVKPNVEWKGDFVGILNSFMTFEKSMAGIVKGIQMLDKTDVDVIIVGRGGGSIEDLWAFNEEIVARAIFECSTPIISAVGHETDFTIADFVADLRAPTPSAAAELAVDDYRSVIEAVSIYRQRLYRAMSGKMDLYRSRLEHFQTKFAYLSPENRLREQRQRLADLENTVQNGMNRKLQDERHRLSVYLERFAGLSPLKKLNQGYSYVADKYKNTLTSVEQVQNGDTIYISVTDGTIEADVTGTVKEERIYGEERKL